MKAKKPAVKPQKDDGDAKLLAKYEHHNEQARKHRAHADLIEAKLRVQGKRIGHEYHAMTEGMGRQPKRKIVKDQ